jgi:hypothetical protein
MLINMGREGIKQTANNILMTYIPLGSLWKFAEFKIIVPTGILQIPWQFYCSLQMEGGKLV